MRDYTTMQVQHDKVLVRLHDAPATHGLIIIPDEARDPSVAGEVLGIGPQQYDCKVGDTVIFSKHAGVPLRSTKDLIVLDGREVLAVRDSEECESQVKRVTYKITGALLADICSVDNEFECYKLRYANYVESVDTLYLTFDVAKPIYVLEEVIAHGK